MRWFAIAYNEWSLRRSKNYFVSKLAMESLEERSCLSADLSVTTPSTLIELSDDASLIASHPLDTDKATSRDEFVSDPVGNDVVSCQRSDWDDKVDDIVSSLDECHDIDPIGSQEHLPERNHDGTAEIGEVDPSSGNSETSPDDGTVTPTIGFGFAEIELAARETGANGFMASGMESSDQVSVESPNASIEFPSAPLIAPQLPKLESRPMVQPVETLQVPAAPVQPQLVVGYAGSALQFSGALPGSDSVKTTSSELLGTPLKTEFFLVSQQNPPESSASARPNIASVVALMPVLGAEAMQNQVKPSKIDENLTAEKTENADSELLAERLLVKLVTYREVEFSRKDEEKEKSTEETADKALNPLCFVVLVGLVGLPQSWRNKVLRTIAARDTRKTPRPISVVPQEDQFEPWRATTFVNREQDETT